MTTLTSPHDLLAAVPFLIGYHPENSLVLIALSDDAIGMAMRVDLPHDLAMRSIELIATDVAPRVRAAFEGKS